MTYRKVRVVLGIILGLVLLATLIGALINTITWVIGMVVLALLCPIWGIALGRCHLRDHHERFRMRH